MWVVSASSKIMRSKDRVAERVMAPYENWRERERERESIWDMVWCGWLLDMVSRKESLV